jgi:hypothetical protein
MGIPAAHFHERCESLAVLWVASLYRNGLVSCGAFRPPPMNRPRATYRPGTEPGGNSVKS